MEGTAMNATTYVHTPATDKQIAFLTKLSVERNVATSEDIAGLAAKGLDKRTASAVIDALLKTPATTATTSTPKTAVEFPAGRYALVNRNDHATYFFQVDRPTEGKWAGYTFVKRVSGDNLLRVDRNEAPQILAAIGEDALGAARRYGNETGNCSVCGRGLTDSESISRGLGPVCAKKF